MAIDAGTRQHNVPVNVCGQMSGSPTYTMLLLGLGLRGFSVPPSAVPEIKKVCRSVTIAQCTAVADRVMTMEHAREIKTASTYVRRAQQKQCRTQAQIIKRKLPDLGLHGQCRPPIKLPSRRSKSVTRIRFAKAAGRSAASASHRDLVRAMERLFRRADVAVRQSEGFHPKPRFMFPSALALGITGQDEVFDVDLDGGWNPDELLARLGAASPPGLVLLTAEVVPAGTKKAQAGRLCYELPLPADRLAAAQAAVERVNAAEHLFAERAGHGAVDLRATLEELTIQQGVLRMTLRAIHTVQARPRDILEVLQLADLEFSGGLLRSRVELAQ